MSIKHMCTHADVEMKSFCATSNNVIIACSLFLRIKKHTKHVKYPVTALTAAKQSSALK